MMPHLSYQALAIYASPSPRRFDGRVANFAAYLLVFVVVAIGNLIKGRCCN